jgi:hypothetical protein
MTKRSTTVGHDREMSVVRGLALTLVKMRGDATKELRVENMAALLFVSTPTTLHFAF